MHDISRSWSARRSAARAIARKPVFVNAGSLFGSTMITSALGFGYWVVASRLFPIHSVGIAAAAVSAMQLLATFGIFGLGTLMIGELADSRSPKGLVTAAALVASFASLVLGVIYVALSPVLSTQLGPLGEGIMGPVLFAVGVGVTGATLVLDQACIGINRGGLQLTRNGVFSLVKLLLLPVGAILANRQTANAIYGAWFVGNVVSLATFWMHARRTDFNTHLRPAFRSLAAIRNTALAHHWLNLAAQAPRLLLPVLVAATLSPELNAAFYTAVLIVSFASIVPAHLATALFALPRGQEDRLARELRGTLRVSVLVSLVSAAVFALVARRCLSLFGPQYLTATNAMIVLGLSTLPFTVKVHYAAVSRVQGRLGRCAWISTVGGLLELVLCYLGAERAGLTGVSAGLVLALTLEAAVLWPTVASAARVRVFGLAYWLFSERIAPFINGEAAIHSRPADQTFFRYWEHLGAMKTGAVPARIRAMVGLASTLLRIVPAARKIRRQTIRIEASSPSGRLLAALLTHRAVVTTVPRVLLSVLVLPESLDRYLRGKRRQALRTNLNNAKRAGIAATELPDSTDSLAAYHESVGSGSETTVKAVDTARSLLVNPGALAMSATDAEGRLLCMGAAIIDGADAYLAKLVSIRDRPGASEARYVVHTALTAELIDRGVRRLWADGPLTVQPGVQKFQRLLGYECARPRISRVFSKRTTDGIVLAKTPAEVPPT
jgi:O-antigen/teichoic acid export membrane protein